MCDTNFGCWGQSVNIFDIVYLNCTGRGWRDVMCKWSPGEETRRASQPMRRLLYTARDFCIVNEIHALVLTCHTASFLPFLQLYTGNTMLKRREKNIYMYRFSTSSISRNRCERIIVESSTVQEDLCCYVDAPKYSATFPVTSMSRPHRNDPSIAKSHDEGGRTSERGRRSGDAQWGCSRWNRSKTSK